MISMSAMKKSKPVPDRRELDGLRVADFTAVMAGPYCTRLMADLGATVVKVEPPGGEHTRTLVPMRDGASAYFGFLNAGKKSVGLDLRSRDGVRAANKLIDWADVVVENYRPGVMAKFGLDYETVAARRPDIVFCSISGFGQHGPWADRPATAQTAHASSGYDLALLAHQPGNDAPLTTGVYPADALAGALSFGGILAALRARDATGTGRYLDMALLDSVLSLMPGEVTRAQFPVGALARGYPPSRTSDGYVMIAGVNQRNFEGIMNTIGRPDLIDDPRFRTNPLRWQNTRELEQIIESWTLTRTSDECEQAMLAAGVPAARYWSVAEQFDNEQATQRGTFITAEDSAGRYQVVDALHFRQPGNGPANPEEKPILRVPAAGEHTREILEELLGVDQADRIIAQGSAYEAIATDTVSS